VAGGLRYLFCGFRSFLSRRFASSLVPYIQMPSGLAGLTFCLWLLIAVVNVTRRKQMETDGKVEYNNRLRFYTILAY
jgi:hypothetical protein